ncbi:MAG: glutamate racemase [Chitinophagaceae bacterium]|nr:MAG: glutamate racemase [Chitinophagaceae bacterium]
MQKANPIGVFDSGYGGLSVLKEIIGKLPEYDYIYLGDNARAPYGNRSFDTVYEYTLQCVRWFFDQGCSLVILACNTASAKALRSIQQRDLPGMGAEKRVLGVIRPTTELIGSLTETGSVGILATNGTVASNSYPVEIAKFYPGVKVYQEACPMWVPLVENNEFDNAGADFFIRKNLQNIFHTGKQIDVLLMACTHYPLMKDRIREHVPVQVKLLSQGEIVAESLDDYLMRHPGMAALCSRNGTREFYTTDSPQDFDNHATRFFGEAVKSHHVQIG